MILRLILKDCENDFDKMKDIYCLKEIEDININDDIIRIIS